MFTLSGDRISNVGKVSYPFILITSSDKSASSLISCLQEGISHKISLPFFVVLIPKFFRITWVSFSSISIPSLFFNLSILNDIVLFIIGIFPAIVVSFNSPPQISIINWDAKSIPASTELGSTPRSNRYLASLNIDNCLPVFAVLTGSKRADSKRTFTVLGVHPVSSPPIIPPRPSTLDLSAITHIPSSRWYSLSSNALNDSPFWEDLTIIFSLILSAS